MYFQLLDDNDTYGIFELSPDIPFTKLQDLVDEYKKTDEEFNADDLKPFLQKKGFVIRSIDYEGIYF